MAACVELPHSKLLRLTHWGAGPEVLGGESSGGRSVGLLDHVAKQVRHFIIIYLF